jgi:hypothetical protein
MIRVDQRTGKRLPIYLREPLVQVLTQSPDKQRPNAFKFVMFFIFKT